MSGPHAFRLIDSGVDDGRRQIAYDAALTDLHAAGEAPDTVRFMRFPPTVLIGRHQVLASEVDLEACRAEGIGLVRRVSGGGAIYLDEGQVGWELVFSRKTLGLTTLDEHARAICEAVAAGLNASFGIAARFRPRNDIEVDGRKLSGSGGYFVGSTIVYQGTVLIDMDAARMARLLNIPAAKLVRHDSATAASRVVTLKELLGTAPSIDAVHSAILMGLRSHLGIEAIPGEPSASERTATQRALDEEIGTDAFVHGTPPPVGENVLEAERQAPGGMLRVFLRLEGLASNRRVREILITGDFFAAPPRAILDLEARLRGVSVGELSREIDGYFDETPIGLLSLKPAEIRDVILQASAKDAS